MLKQHFYTLSVEWTGNKGSGTLNYRAYSRSHLISIPGKETIFGSSDPAFRGEKEKYNPEELLLASVAGCHMLWFLHICADNNVVVMAYTDTPKAIMEEDEEGSGVISEVTLSPVVTFMAPVPEKEHLGFHHQANKKCFIANSVKFPIKHNPTSLIYSGEIYG